MFNPGIRYTRRKQAPLSKHGAIRSQQRSVPAAIIDALIDYGDEHHDGSGAVRYSFTKRTWRAFAAYVGTISKHYEGYRSAYVVIAEDGSVITVGWRH